MMKKLLFSVACCLGFLLVTCARDGVTGGSTETSANVKGTLRNGLGHPAAGAAVRFYRADYNPHASGLGKLAAVAAAAVKADTTDANGAFSVTLDTGTYTLLADGADGKAFSDSIRVGASGATSLDDTLRPPGTLHGTIRLPGGDDGRTVFIVFMGTDTIAMPDDSLGDYTIAGLAAGRHRVRILSTLDSYLPKDTVLTVVPGETTEMPPIALSYTGIPVPAGLRIEYDTMKQIARLVWNKPTAGAKIGGYTIYRACTDSGQAPASLATRVTTDTAFSDSTGVQDLTYEYRVALRDTSGNEGKRSAGARVKVEGAWKIADSIVKGNAANVDGNFGGTVRGVLDNTGCYYIVDDYNNWLQKIAATGNFIYKVTSFLAPISIASYSDSLLFVCDYNARKIFRTKLNGTVDTSFATLGRPSGVSIKGDSVFISSDSGVIIHDLNGKLLNVVRYAFSNALSPSNVAASDNGKLYAVEDRGVFEVDIQTQTVKNIWTFKDMFANQQAMICQYNGDTLSIVSSGGNAPFFSSLYLISTSGNLISKCKLRYSVGGITKSASGTLTGFSGEGRILTLTR